MSDLGLLAGKHFLFIRQPRASWTRRFSRNRTRTDFDWGYSLFFLMLKKVKCKSRAD